MTEPLYFFGYIGNSGHVYWDITNGRPNHHRGSTPGPWGDHIDSDEISPAFGSQGDTYLHYLDGWTALAIVDHTGDSRPGSRSVFITKGTLSFDAMVLLVTDRWSSWLFRIGPLHQVKEKSA